MKKLLFKFFIWQLEIKLSRTEEASKERIILLGNMLFNELKKSGCDLKCSTSDMEYAEIVNYKTRKVEEIDVRAYKNEELVSFSGIREGK